MLKISSDGKVSTIFNSENDWSPIGVAATDDGVYVLEARPYWSAIHTGNRVLKISTDGKATIITNLEEAIKTVGLPNINNNSLLKTNNIMANGNPASIRNSLILVSIIGVVIAAFVMLIFLARKKWQISG